MLRDKYGDIVDSNIESYIEIKFKKDTQTVNQLSAQEKMKNKGQAKRYVVLTEEDCCPESDGNSRAIREAVEQSAKNAEKAMFLFGPPGAPGRPPIGRPVPIITP